MDVGGNVNTNDKDWAVIWEAATITTMGGIENLARRIQKFVFPVIKRRMNRVNWLGDWK